MFKDSERLNIVYVLSDVNINSTKHQWANKLSTCYANKKKSQYKGYI